MLATKPSAADKIIQCCIFCYNLFCRWNILYLYLVSNESRRIEHCRSVRGCSDEFSGVWEGFAPHNLSMSLYFLRRIETWSLKRTGSRRNWEWRRGMKPNQLVKEFMQDWRCAKWSGSAHRDALEPWEREGERGLCMVHQADYEWKQEHVTGIGLELGSTLEDTDKQSEHGVFISRLREQTTVIALHSWETLLVKEAYNVLIQTYTHPIPWTCRGTQKYTKDIL